MRPHRPTDTVTKLRIAMLAPLKRPITPEVTASRPRVMYDLITELVSRGHSVTVFGTGDSDIPGVSIVPIIPQGLNFLPQAENPEYQHMGGLTRLIMTVNERQNEFDIIHNHMYPEFLALLAGIKWHTPMVTTVHAQMTEDMVHTLKYFPDAHLVAISEVAKRASGLPMTVIHNGIDTDFFVSDPSRQKKYLLFVGRMSKAKGKDGRFLDPKGVTTAIALAEKLEERLKIVGNVEDRAFYDELIKPHLSDSITFIGEVSPEQTQSREEMLHLFQGAKAFVNPINWEEPFGLVMIEAMACGTPVVAYNRGSVSEIVRDGVTGFIVEPEDRGDEGNKGDRGEDQTPWVIKKRGIEGLVEAVKRIGEIDRAACREQVARFFSKRRMAIDYEMLYADIVG